MTKQERERIRDYAITFGGQSGQRVLADLQAAYGRRLSYTPGDPYETAFKEGARQVILRIEGQLAQTKLPIETDDDVGDDEHGG